MRYQNSPKAPTSTRRPTHVEGAPLQVDEVARCAGLGMRLEMTLCGRVDFEGLNKGDFEELNRSRYIFVENVEIRLTSPP